MEQKKNESFIILLVSLSCIGLTVESILLGWEFWVPPLIIIGTVFLWILNLSERTDYRIRRAYYLIYAMLATFFHGVHESSFFDVALVVILVMVGYSFFDRVYMMNLILAEYVVIMIIQFMLSANSKSIEFNQVYFSKNNFPLNCGFFKKFSMGQADRGRL